jgi:hypothetical protein
VAGAGDIRAGAAYVELALRDNLSKGLDKAGARVQAFGASVSTLGKQALAGATVAAGGLLGVVTSFASQGSHIQQVAAKLGTTAEAVSELQYAAELAGGSLEEVEIAAAKLGKTVSDAAAGSQQASDALESIGLHAKQLYGLKVDQQFEVIAKAVEGVNDPARRAALLMGVIGEGGAKLAPILARGAEGFKAVKQEARDLGVVLSTDQANAAKDLADGWYKLTKVFQSAVNVLGETLAPTLNDLLGKAQGNIIAAREWLQANGGLLISVAKLIPAVAAAGAGLVALGVALSATGLALGVAAKAVAILATGVGFLLSPIGLTVAAVGALGAAWATLTPEGTKAAGEIGEAWKDTGSDIKGAFAAIVESVKAGNLEDAAKLGALALQIEYEKVIQSLGKTWAAFARGVQTTFDRPSSALRAIAQATGQGYYDSGARNFNERVGGAINSATAFLGDPIGRTATLQRFSAEDAGLINGGRQLPGMLPGSEGGAGLLTRAAASLAEVVKTEFDKSTPLTDAQKRINELRAQLAEATTMRRGADASLPGKLIDELRRAPAGVAAAADSLTLSGSRGTFNARNAAGSLGLSDQAKQVEAIDSVRREVEELKDVVKRAAEIS